MRHDAEAPQTPHVFHDITRLASQREWRLRKADRDVVTALRAQLDGIDDEHSGSELRRVCPARAVAVIGQDDELQSRAGRRGRNLVWRAGAVGTIGVNVKRAGRDWCCGGGRWKRDASFGERKQQKKKSGGQNGRRHQYDAYLAHNGSYSPAALRSASARSVFSQVNSGSERPKCPNAAVFL